jgi:hypothetical protein
MMPFLPFGIRDAEYISSYYQDLLGWKCDNDTFISGAEVEVGLVKRQGSYYVLNIHPSKFTD